jgi:hypothetical protein
MVECADTNPFFSSEPGFTDCAKEMNGTCVSGGVTYDVQFVDDLLRLVDIAWDCSRGGIEAIISGNCACSARYNYRACAQCHVCGEGEPGGFHLECPGFAVDCDNNYTLWQDNYPAQSGYHGTVSMTTATMLILTVSMITGILILTLLEA